MTFISKEVVEVTENRNSHTRKYTYESQLSILNKTDFNDVVFYCINPDLLIQGRKDASRVSKLLYSLIVFSGGQNGTKQRYIIFLRTLWFFIRK